MSERLKDGRNEPRKKIPRKKERKKEVKTEN